MKKRHSLLILTPFLTLPTLANGATTGSDISIDHLNVVAENKIFLASMDTDVMGQGEGSRTSLLPEETGSIDSDELFGSSGGGYLHPYLGITGEYTDNLYNVNNDQKSNFLTRISPGIWLSVPSSKEPLLTLDPSNTAAGGLQLAARSTEGFDRLNAYLLGGLDFKFYSEDSDLNATDGMAEGLFQYNLRGGLSFRLVDRYTRGQDQFDAGNATSPNNLRRYKSNIGLFGANWDFSEKLGAKFEYSNFWLNYDDTVDEFLNRMDNSLSGQAIYKYSVKTDFFLEYRHVDISYDTASEKDSKDNFVYGGIKWDSTEKTALSLKAGYQDKTYKEDLLSQSDTSGLALEMTLEYQFSPKTAFALALSHKIDETDSALALNKKTFNGTLRYEQKFTERLAGICDLSYSNENYDQLPGTAERVDKRYFIKPALQYTFKDWLMAELAYSFNSRNSKDDFYDYDSNTIYFSLNSSL